ncbi:MAG: 4-(cytidine 5'-diphospho)-2-C-methyl-D-erythritol kinase [Clostridia bacterium]|nr:4-(cytidine 5'-diphospho)-2-C-methyl-D-erythritol kinase [Clostridia bacterium]
MLNKTFKRHAYGKINLYLDVLDKRSDGYHNIRSVMQTVSLCDTISLSIEPSEENVINITCSDPSIACDSSNLVYKAGMAFLLKYRGKCMIFNFHIEKNIPVSAGMAGGSADASAVLHLMNEVYGYPYSEDELCEIGSHVGADVAFCVKGGTCICEGIGEILTRLPTFSGFTLVYAKDCSSVSTPSAFRMLDEKYGIQCADSSDINKVVSSVIKKDLYGVCSSLYNKFESVILPINQGVEFIKNKLVEYGAIGTLMSGSGPSVFAIFDNEIKAHMASDELNANKIRAGVCKTI